MTRVVLDALAVPDFGQHFQIEARTLFQPLRFHQLAFVVEILEAIRQFQLDAFHRAQHLLARRDVMAARVHGKTRQLLPHLAGERIEQLQRLDLVIEQLDAQRQLAVFGRKHVDGVTTHAELAARELHLVALILHAHQLRDDVALAVLVACAQRHDHAVVALGLADTVDGRHSGHNHHIAPFQQTLGAAQPHLLDVLVDGAVLLDEQVALRHVGFRLVVVVVADEILHRVLRKELAEFAVQLRRQRLVGRKHDGRPAQPGNHVGHGEGLARASHAQQGLVGLAIVHTFHQLVDGRGLVARRRIRLEQLKRRIGELHELSRRRGSLGGIGEDFGLWAGGHGNQVGAKRAM